MAKHDYNIGFCSNCGKREFKSKLDTARILEVDTLLISSRHLYRAPYSLHEKSGLVSIPIDSDNILKFDKRDAEPQNVTTNYKFMQRNAKHDEAGHLFLQAFDFTASQREKEKESFTPIEVPATAIPEQHFPQCIKRISEGLEDGRKRAIFILINFLRSVGWSPEQVESYAREWNERNNQSLRENYLVGQLRYAKRKKPMLPPNCNNTAYYQSMGVKCSENICMKVKNPVVFAKRGARHTKRSKKE